LPVQLPLAHSKPDWHEVPSASGGDEQMPSFPAASASTEQVPLQQSPLLAHTAPVARQGPGPGSHRLDVVSQVPQHCVPPPELQSSPEGRQVSTGSRTHRLPCDGSHSFEQHCALLVQAEPSRRHSPPPHAPSLHASEQQSLARVHAVPSPWHAARHTSVVLPSAGSHRPLQQSERDAHGVPAPEHVPGATHAPEAQWVEQQSEALPHASPSARQAGGGPALSHTATLPSSAPIVPSPPSFTLASGMRAS
jgi:hypothetical protein